MWPVCRCVACHEFKLFFGSILCILLLFLVALMTILVLVHEVKMCVYITKLSHAKRYVKLCFYTILSSFLSLMREVEVVE